MANADPMQTQHIATHSVGEGLDFACHLLASAISHVAGQRPDASPRLLKTLADYLAYRYVREDVLALEHLVLLGRALSSSPDVRWDQFWKQLDWVGQQIGVPPQSLGTQTDMTAAPDRASAGPHYSNVPHRPRLADARRHGQSPSNERTSLHSPSTRGARENRQRTLPPLRTNGVPPRGDPRRPVMLAIRSMRVLCVLAFIVAAIMTWRTYTGSPRRIAASTLVRNVGVYAGAGVAYLVCLFGLRERRFWAVVLGLVIAGLNLLGVCIFFGLLSLSAYRGPPLQTQSELTITLIVSGVWIIALGQLAWHLALSIKGIGYDMEGYADADPAGFDVTPPPTKAPSSRSA